jgi:hypothetical protein
VRRVWKWLKEPGAAWWLVGVFMFLGGLVALFTEDGEPLAFFAYSLAATTTARVKVLEEDSLEQDHIIIALLKVRVMERQRQQRETN